MTITLHLLYYIGYLCSFTDMLFSKATIKYVTDMQLQENHYAFHSYNQLSKFLQQTILAYKLHVLRVDSVNISV